MEAGRAEVQSHLRSHRESCRQLGLHETLSQQNSNSFGDSTDSGSLLYHSGGAGYTNLPKPGPQGCRLEDTKVTGESCRLCAGQGNKMKMLGLRRFKPSSR